MEIVCYRLMAKVGLLSLKFLGLVKWVSVYVRGEMYIHSGIDSDNHRKKNRLTTCIVHCFQSICKEKFIMFSNGTLPGISMRVNCTSTLPIFAKSGK